MDRRSASFGRDRGLQARMLMTMFLLGLVYAVLIGTWAGAELEAVLGHELTHVQNRDVMVMTIASFFASVASFIAQMGFWFGGAFGGDDDDNGPGFIVVILVSAVVYMISFVLLQALSRYREFAADRGSAIITGRPSALISALYKIRGTIERISQR